MPGRECSEVRAAASRYFRHRPPLRATPRDRYSNDEELAYQSDDGGMLDVEVIARNGLGVQHSLASDEEGVGDVSDQQRVFAAVKHGECGGCPGWLCHVLHDGPGGEL